jgi:hypothetical protein
VASTIFCPLGDRLAPCYLVIAILEAKFPLDA